MAVGVNRDALVSHVSAGENLECRASAENGGIQKNFESGTEMPTEDYP